MNALLALTRLSLQIESRRLRTYGLRAGLLALILLNLLSIRENHWAAEAQGKRLFDSLMWSNLVFLTAAALYAFAGSISDEKEYQTLPLLRMTRLSALSILLGKSAAQLASVAMLLLIQYPFTMLAITLGGVSPAQISASYACLLSYLALLWGLGVVASVVARTSQQASGLAALALLGLTAGPWLFLGVLMLFVALDVLPPKSELLTHYESLLAVHTQHNPMAQLWQIQSVGFSGAAFTPQVASSVALGGGLFALAWAVFDVFNRHEAPRARRSWLSAGGSKLRRSGEVWPAALAWKDQRFLAGGTRFLWAKFGLYGLLVLFVGVAAEVDTVPELGGLTLGICIPLGLLELAVMAQRLFSVEVQDRTLPVLMILPQSIASWAYGKLLGAAIGVVPALAWVALGLLATADKWDPSLNDLFMTGWVITYGLLYLHVTAYVSLYTRSATLLTFLGMYFGTSTMAGVLMALTWGTSAATSSLVSAAIATVVIAVAARIAFGGRGALIAALSSALVFLVAATLTEADPLQLQAVAWGGLFLGLCAVLQSMIATRLKVLAAR